MLKAYADCFVCHLVTLLIPSYEVISTFSPQERVYIELFSSWSQHFIIDMARRIVTLKADISAVKYCAAQRWEKLKLTLSKKMMPVEGSSSTHLFL